jgi:hexosaminidase
MSWRGEEGGIQAARAGHDVVMTPTSHCHLDYYQADPEKEPIAIGGLLRLEEVYRYDPTPDVLTKEEAKHILGVQGNVWTEYMPGPQKVEYMAFPRGCAMAELAWTPEELKDWDDFQRRLSVHYLRLKARGVNYRPTRIQNKP